jgi:hypothetical protein
MYVVWQDGRFTGRAAIALSRSTDGGRSWSTPIKVNQTPLLGNLNDQAFTPSGRLPLQHGGRRNRHQPLHRALPRSVQQRGELGRE